MLQQGKRLAGPQFTSQRGRDRNPNRVERSRVMNGLAKLNPFKRQDVPEGVWPFGRMHPFLDMERALERMERLFAPWPNGDKEALAVAEWSPLVDVTEDDKEYLIKAEVPEVRKDDIKVTVEE